MDTLNDFAYGVVATAPSPATSGTSLTLQSGQGAAFPAAPFNLLMWPSGQSPLNSNAEIARCTAISTDTLTITRNIGPGGGAQPVAVGYQVCQPIDVNLINQIVALIPLKVLLAYSQLTTGHNYNIVGADFAAIDTGGTANNLFVTFTAPASGIVLVHLNGVVEGTTAADAVYWGVINHATGNIIGPTAMVLKAAATGDTKICSAVIEVTGLTPGTSYQLDWAAAGTSTGDFGLRIATSGGGTGSAPSGATAPATMEVWGG